VVKNAIVRNSIIQEHSEIKNALLENAMIGSHATYEGSRSDVSLGDYSSIKT